MSERMKRIRQAAALLLSMGYTRDEVARSFRADRRHERMLRWMENGGLISNKLSTVPLKRSQMAQVQRKPPPKPSGG